MTPSTHDEVCEQHDGAVAVAHCTACGKPICRECTNAFGYFCSAACLEDSRGHVSPVDRQRQVRESAELERAAWIGKLMGVIILVALLIGIGFLTWKFFLDPAGKICWTWERTGSLYAFSVLSGDADVVLVRAADQIVTLETAKGRATGTIVPQKDQKGRTEIEPVEDGFLLMSANMVARYDHDGTERFKRTSDWERLLACQSPDGTRQFLCMGSPRPKLSPAERLKPRASLPPRKVVLSCLDLDSGKSLWSVHLGERERIGEIAASADLCFALHESWTERYEVHAVLRAYDADSGKPRWEASLPASPTWGPVAAGDLVLIQLNDTFHAFSSAGRAVWTREMPTTISGKRLLDEALLINTANGTQLLESATGNRRWQSPGSLVLDSISAQDDRLLAIGFIAGAEDAEEADAEESPGPFPGSLEKNKDLLSDMGIDLGKMSGSSAPLPSLVCIDAGTGRLRWQVPKVYGDLCSDGERLVLVMDTARTSILEKVSGGKGVLVLRQYDPGNGKMLYSRTSDVGLRNPRICGNRLVGIWYERTERPSLMSGFSSGIDISPPKALGVVAFRLR